MKEIEFINTAGIISVFIALIIGSTPYTIGLFISYLFFLGREVYKMSKEPNITNLTP